MTSRRSTPSTFYRFLPLGLSLFIFSTVAHIHCSAADTAFYVMTKGMGFEQTDATTMVPDSEGPYYFFVGAFGTSPESITSLDLRTPLGETETVLPEDGECALEASFASAAELNALIPDDADTPYSLTIRTENDGDVETALNFPGAAYPTAPRLANYAEAQEIDHEQSFILQWDPFEGGTTDDFIFVNIDDTDFQIPPTDPNPLNGTATSVEIPAGTLRPGRAYRVDIEFHRVADSNTTDYPGVTGFSSYYADTQVEIHTTGTPDRPQQAWLSYSVSEYSVYLNDPLSGQVGAWMPEVPTPHHVLELRVEDVVELPESVVFHTPMESPHDTIPSVRHWESPEEPNVRTYVSDFLGGSSWPSAGLYTVEYADTDLEINIEDPALEEHTIRVIPDITLDESGQFKEIRWSYQNLMGEPCALPSGLTELSIWLNQDIIPRWFPELPVNSTSLTLPTPLAWSDVWHINFNFRDTQDNNFTSGSSRSPGFFRPQGAEKLPVATVGEPFSDQLEIFGGSPPYQWEKSDRFPWPEWLSLSPEGVISGTPPTAGSHGFSINVADAKPAGGPVGFYYDIRVKPEGDILDFDGWLAVHFAPAQLSDPAVVGPNADPDKDRCPNLVEFAFAMTPTAPDSLGEGITLEVTSDWMVISYPENLLADGILITPEINSTLENPLLWRGLLNGGAIPLGIFLGDVKSQLVPQSEPGRHRREVSIRRPDDLDTAWLRLIVSQP